MITSDKILDLYDGDGTTTSFPITIEHTGKDDLKVELVDKETGSYTLLDEGTDWIYTVVGAAISCEAAVAPTSDYQLMISLDLPFTQEAEWIQDGPFAHNVLNRALDKLTLLAKQLKGVIGGAIHAPIEELETDLRLPTKASRANQYLYFDADGKPTTDPNVTAKPVSDFMQGVITQETAYAAKVALDVEELARYTVSAKSADYTITDTDLIDVLEVTCGDQDRTITLPTLADNQGRVLIIKKMDAWGHNVIIEAEGSETIEGKSSKTLLRKFDKYTLVAGSTEWDIVGDDIPLFVTEIVGSSLFRQWIVKMSDGTYRFNCGTSDATNLIGGNGLSSLVFHNQAYPIIPSKHGVAIKQLEVKGGIAAVLFEDGELFNCGLNGSGQQAVGNTVNQAVFVKTADNVNRFWLADYQGYSKENTHWFHEKNDGSIYGVGRGIEGQLGLGDSLDKSSWTEITFFSDKTVLELFPGGCQNGNTFAETSDGNIYYTGANTLGQSGNGGTAAIPSWTVVTTAWGGVTSGAVGRIKKIIVGSGFYTTSFISYPFNGMLREDGSIRTCGSNLSGYLGDYTGVDKSTPVTVSIPDPVVQLELVGHGGVYARSSTNKVYRWGHNPAGVLGDGDTLERYSPYNTGLTDNIDNNCDLMLLGNSYCEIYPTKSNQYLRDERDHSIWGCGQGLDYLVPSGDGATADVLSYIQLAMEDEAEIVQAKQLGNNTERFIIMLDSRGRIWYVGDNSLNQASHFGIFNTDAYPVPMLVNIE